MKKQLPTAGVAVVTGGAQGIGFATAMRLGRKGYPIALWDADSDALAGAKEELESFTSVGTWCVDVRDLRAIEDAASATEAELGTIAVLVHSAGVAGPNASLVDYEIEDWRNVIDIDLNGTFIVNKVIAARMQASGYGRILNVASVAGKEGNPNACAYSAAKAGVIALTKSLGKELAETNISVNCVTPAAAQTRLFDQMSAEHIEFMLSKIPRKRFLQTHEAAAMIEWLVSPENSFTTGAVFDLSGGRATY